MKRFKTVNSLQSHLKNSIMISIETRLTEICVEVVRRYLDSNVYTQYVDPNSYDRTFELRDSVTVGDLRLGTKFAYFNVFMDSSKIKPHIRNQRPVNSSGDSYGGWNAHADVYDLDMSEYIPMWVEHGTEGGLYEREPANYMYDSWMELEGGKLANALEDALRREGWEVVKV